MSASTLPARRKRKVVYPEESAPPSPPDPPKRLLVTVDEMAYMLSIGRPKAWKLVASGEIFSVQVGHSRRIPVAKIEEFVAQLMARSN